MENQPQALQEATAMSEDSKSPQHASSGVGKPAVYPDTERVANVIKKKIDYELDGLKPHPPNPVMKVMRLAAYPMGLIAGIIFAHREARDGVEKYAAENEHFSNGDVPLATFSDKDSTGIERLNAHIKEVKTNNVAKQLKIRDKLGMPAEKPEGLVKSFVDTLEEGRRTILLASAEPARRSKIIFNGLFASTAAMGLLLTLSDNKNFLNFGKKSNVSKDVTLDR